MKFSMRLYQQRGIYYLEIDKKRRSLKTRDKAEARRLFAQIKKEWLAGKLAHLTGKCTVTLAEFGTEFMVWSESVQTRSTSRANRLALSKLEHYAGSNTLLDRITLKHADAMVAEHLRSGARPASVNNYLRHARASLNKAVEWGHVKTNPLAGIKELTISRTSTAFLDRSSAARFVAGIKDLDLRRIVVAYLVTGRRRSELLNLTWGDIDHAGQRYRIVAKGGKTQWHPINRMFQSVIASIAREKGGSPGGRVFDRWEHPDTLSHLVKKCLLRAGFGHLHLHHLRHTFASLKLMDGLSLPEVGKLLGHGSVTATQIYAHLSDDHVREIAEVNLGPVDLG
jgi:integrase